MLSVDSIPLSFSSKWGRLRLIREPGERVATPPLGVLWLLADRAECNTEHISELSVPHKNSWSSVTATTMSDTALTCQTNDTYYRNWVHNLIKRGLWSFLTIMEPNFCCIAQILEKTQLFKAGCIFYLMIQ